MMTGGFWQAPDQMGNRGRTSSLRAEVQCQGWILVTSISATQVPEPSFPELLDASQCPICLHPRPTLAQGCRKCKNGSTYACVEAIPI